MATITHGAFSAPSGKLFPESQNRLTHVLVKGSEGREIVHGHNVQVDADATVKACKEWGVICLGDRAIVLPQYPLQSISDISLGSATADDQPLREPQNDS